MNNDNQNNRIRRKSSSQTNKSDPSLRQSDKSTSQNKTKKSSKTKPKNTFSILRGIGVFF